MLIFRHPGFNDEGLDTSQLVSNYTDILATWGVLNCQNQVLATRFSMAQPKQPLKVAVVGAGIGMTLADFRKKTTSHATQVDFLQR